MKDEQQVYLPPTKAKPERALPKPADKVTAGHSPSVHALCFCSYQLNSPAPLESLYQRTLCLLGVSYLGRFLGNKASKQRRKPLEIQTLHVSRTLAFSFCFQKHFPSKTVAQYLERHFINIVTFPKVCCSWQDDALLVWDSGNETVFQEVYKPGNC